MKYWREWYGIFRAILEVMRTDSDVLIRDIEIDAIAFRLHYDSSSMRDILEYMVSIDLLCKDEEDHTYYSERLQDDAEYMREKSSKAKASADARRKKKTKKNANALQSQSESNAIKDSIVKENKVKQINNNILSEQDIKDKIQEIYWLDIIKNNKNKFRLATEFVKNWYNLELKKEKLDDFFCVMIDKSHRYWYSAEWVGDRDTLLLKAKEMYEWSEWKKKKIENHMSTFNNFLSPKPKK